MSPVIVSSSLAALTVIPLLPAIPKLSAKVATVAGEVESSWVVTVLVTVTTPCDSLTVISLSDT